MEPLAWFATTPEGERLGQLAAGSVQIVVDPRPWWTFPLEPVHWFYSITGATPHSFYSAALYLAMALLGALWAARRAGFQARLAWMITLGMTLLGGMQANGWLYTVIPHGIRWQSPPQATFRLADLHCHTQASGGCLMPEDVLRWHLAKGFSVVGITDSNKTYPAERALEQAETQGLPVVVVPGEEYRGSTHLLMLNLPQPIRADQVEISQAIRQARAQGALVIVAHIWTGQHTAGQLLDWGAEGFEIDNGRTMADQATLDLCRQRSLPTLGTLDFRQGNSPRTATVLPAWADSAAKVQQALQRGECATLFCPAWIEGTRFSPWQRLRHELPDEVEMGGALLVPGLIFWATCLIMVSRWVHPRPWRCLGPILGLSCVSGILGLWSVWWRFKLGWFPRVELALAAWALICPLCWYLACCQTRSGQNRRQHAVQIG